jgi:hypothetical protein
VGARTHRTITAYTCSASRPGADCARHSPRQTSRRHDGHIRRCYIKTKNLGVRWRNGLQVLDDVWALDVGSWLGRITSGYKWFSTARVLYSNSCQDMMIVVRGSDRHESSSSRTCGVATSVRPTACPDPHFCLNTKECIRQINPPHLALVRLSISGHKSAPTTSYTSPHSFLSC